MAWKLENIRKDPISKEMYSDLFISQITEEPKTACLFAIGDARAVEIILEKYKNTQFVVFDYPALIKFLEFAKPANLLKAVPLRYDWESEDAFLKFVGELQNYNINNMPFDLIIANPPYGRIGTQIFQKLKAQCNNYVIGLDQSADIKRDKLFQYISYIKGPFNCFKDASVIVYAFILKKTKVHDKDWDEWSSDTRFDKDWVPFYKRNFARKEPFTYHCWESEETWTRLFNEKKTFLLTMRTVLDGTHSDDIALDIAWNKNNMCKFTPGERTTGGFSSINKEGKYAAQGYEFKTIEEKENIIHWWYNSKIASYLCWGLKKQSFGRGYLPRINWNKEGVSKEDYTDDYVIKELGLKWKDENDPTKGVDFLEEKE